MRLKALFRVRLASLKSSLTGANRSTRKRSKAQILGFAVLMLYTFGYFAFMLYTTFDTLAGPFSAMDLGTIYFALAALMAFALMFVGSIFSAKAQLYEATDNDLLLSMPVKPGEVLLSRMLLLLVMNLLFDLIVAGPAMLAWFQAAGFSLGSFLCSFAVLFVLLPLISLALSSVFGFLLHLISARVRNQSLMTVVLSLAFLAVYFVAISRMNIWITNLAADPTPLAHAIGGVAPLVWLGRACVGGDLLALGALALLTAALLLLIWVALERSFVKTATAKNSVAKVKYVEKAVDAVSPDRALLRRELKHFAACPSYILNSALGVIMAPIAAVYLIIKRSSLLPLMQEPGFGFLLPLLPLLLLLGLCFMASMCTVTAPSISLEGKSLWLLQSLPVTPRQVLRAKLRMHLLIALPPMLICSVIFIALLRPSLPFAVCVLLLPAACVLFTGLLGLFENLRHPNLDWINETQAVKTGMAVAVTMFATMGLLMLPILVIIFFGDMIPPVAIAAGLLVLVLLLCLLLWRWLVTRGEERFRAL